MLSNIGLPTLLFIILIALLLFGPQKLPELGRAMGKTLREFKRGAKEVLDDDEPVRPATSQQGAQAPAGPLMARDDKVDDRRLPE